MIRVLRVKNFQRHVSLRLKLDPHVTTIVGPSDVGKSALLRAVKWACLNEPRGASFLRKGAKSKRVSVTLHVDDHKVTRAKGKDNSYHMDGARFSAIGSSVPKEVATVLNVTDLNFQDQITLPFWFSLTPGEVSRQLNSIVDLEIIDTTLAKLASSHRKARVEREVTQARLTSAIRDRDVLKPATAGHKALCRVERTEKRAARAARRAALLADLLRDAQTHKEEVQSLAQSRRLGRELRKIEKLTGKLDSLREREQELAQLLTNVRKLKERVEDATAAHKETHEKFYDMLGDRCPLCGSSQQLPF